MATKTLHLLMQRCDVDGGSLRETGYCDNMISDVRITAKAGISLHVNTPPQHPTPVKGNRELTTMTAAASSCQRRFFSLLG